ncbi:hypothetical protein TTHERM_000479100 (macronuclear) [Tetrahymena thermophila SB210]|uniref:Uncharacterized protein n=1 Tax=Tetrahymena thermophila (strain SB210) TaxID=312017 RepID=W7XHU9_TETTS|nr:hypothetical protein TTHERM_000479100 [Tetrahymena thermophila SB210]EWS74066.1 hypothetical protein TTHERM_000479100 [Tetrahymena thermophila SB210]|eukprot:XP_012653399.1 hypothetical protein TTHERM_000479100 [Tetrahymena thermophila SB210]
MNKSKLFASLNKWIYLSDIIKFQKIKHILIYKKQKYNYNFSQIKRQILKYINNISFNISIFIYLSAINLLSNQGLKHSSTQNTNRHHNQQVQYHSKDIYYIGSSQNCYRHQLRKHQYTWCWLLCNRQEQEHQQLILFHFQSALVHL